MVSTKVKAYLGLVFVVFVWGVGPLFTASLLKVYSPSIYSAIGSLISATALLIISAGRLRELNSEYFRLAIPTGLFVALASLIQKIGLQYTTPAKYSFLENLSCITVPILLFILIKKKPKPLTVLSCLMCLVGSSVLTETELGGGIGRGELLCALAGIFYGVNIAVTGTYTKNLYAPMYVMIQLWVQTAVSLIAALGMNFIRINGEPMETIRISWRPEHIIGLAALVLVSSTLCWVVRTNAMKRVDAAAVAVLMPCSSVVTGIASVIAGIDTLSPNLVIGALIDFAAAVISGLSDARERTGKSGRVTAKGRTDAAEPSESRAEASSASEKVSLRNLKK